MRTYCETTVLDAKTRVRTFVAFRMRFACIRLIAVWIFVIGTCLELTAAPAAIVEAKAIFSKRCTVCHTFGKGVKVGPDLKGVTERRPREWLVRFIRTSSSVIQSGDPTATKLFRDFKQERMPDWSDLSREQVNAILDYFAGDGPLQKEPDERDASTATADEIEIGRQLFHGVTRLNFGGRSCKTCHAIRGGKSTGGSLGPDLTGAYFKYRDAALTDFLRRPCLPREPESSASGYLTLQESFELKAYMAKAGGLSIPSGPLTSQTPAAGQVNRSREENAIDPSVRAAREVDKVAAGLAPVRLKGLKEGEFLKATLAASAFAVQVGAFEDEQKADQLKKQLEQKYPSVTVQPFSADKTLYRVRIGEPDLETANRIAAELRKLDLKPFLVRLNAE
jgi:mono/diheme cytochrome c family protein